MNIAEHITQLKQDIDDVYIKGYEDGQASGGGGSDEYDKFWDMVQQKGNRKDYQQAFRNWYIDDWKPKYDIQPTLAMHMFYATKYHSSDSTRRLPELVANAGITLDFSKCTGFSQFCSYSWITHYGTIDTTGATALTSAFIYAEQMKQLHLKIKDNGSTTFLNSFTGSPNLEDFQIVSGKIGQDFDISPTKVLNKTSITSIINALLESASGKTVTLSKTAVNNAFGINVDDEATYPEGSEYYILRHSKDNWTFSYL